MTCDRWSDAKIHPYKKSAFGLPDKPKDLHATYSSFIHQCDQLFIWIFVTMLSLAGIGFVLNVFYYLCCDSRRSVRNCWRKEEEEDNDEAEDEVELAQQPMNKKRAERLTASNENLLMNGDTNGGGWYYGKQVQNTVSKEVHVSNSYGNERLGRNTQTFSSEYDVGGRFEK